MWGNWVSYSVVFASGITNCSDDTVLGNERNILVFYLYSWISRIIKIVSKVPFVIINDRHHNINWLTSKLQSNMMFTIANEQGNGIEFPYPCPLFFIHVNWLHKISCKGVVKEALIFTVVHANSADKPLSPRFWKCILTSFPIFVASTPKIRSCRNTDRVL